MSEALEQAYASNTQTPLHTIEFSHSGLSGGVLRLVRGYSSLTATLEDSSTVTFQASGFAISLPEKGTDGKQDLQIQLDNVSLEAYQQIKAAKDQSRVSNEKIICRYRAFLESDLSQPAGGVYRLVVTKTSIDRSSVTVVASYAPIPDISWPSKRYYPSSYPGVLYA